MVTTSGEIQACKGSLKSFIHRLPATNYYSSREVLELFWRRKNKYTQIIMENMAYFLEITYTELCKKEKITKKIFQ